MSMSRQDRTQAIVDAFYREHGPCCAGCDWWRWHSSLVGECIRTAPVSGAERFAMLGATSYSLSPDAGHIMTLRDHVCGEFKDEPATQDIAKASAESALRGAAVKPPLFDKDPTNIQY